MLPMTADLSRSDRRPPAADAMHEVRLSRVPSVCCSDRAGRGGDRSMSARRRGGDREARRAARVGRQAAEPGQRRGAAACRGTDRRELVHRLHAMHPGMSGRRHRRSPQADAHGAAGALHRLRTVYPALPRGLHRDGGGRRTGAGVERPLRITAPSSVQPRHGRATSSIWLAVHASAKSGKLVWPPKPTGNVDGQTGRQFRPVRNASRRRFARPWNGREPGAPEPKL